MVVLGVLASQVVGVALAGGEVTDLRGLPVGPSIGYMCQ